MQVQTGGSHTSPVLPDGILYKVESCPNAHARVKMAHALHDGCRAARHRTRVEDEQDRRVQKTREVCRAAGVIATRHPVEHAHQM